MRKAIVLNLVALPLWIALILTDSRRGADWASILVIVVLVLGLGVLVERWEKR